MKKFLRLSSSFSSLSGLAGLLLMVCTNGAAMAESLEEALGIAYRTNPTMQAQRASLRAAGELKYQALANLLPQITANGAVGRQNIRQESAAGGAFNTDTFQRLNQLSYGGNGDFLLFDGFRTINAFHQKCC